MKICITSQGNTLDSQLDPRFGRCAFFLIADTETDDMEFVENQPSGGGAGISAGQLMVQKGVETVITGSVGPNASQVLKSSGIEIYKGTAKSVKENLDSFRSNVLGKLEEIAESHSGLKKGLNQ